MSNSPASTDLVIDEEKATLSGARHLVALEATWEIGKLCHVLRTVVEIDESMEFYAVRGLSARIEDLSNVIMGALGDEVDSTKDLAFKLRREREEVA